MGLQLTMYVRVHDKIICLAIYSMSCMKYDLEYIPSMLNRLTLVCTTTVKKRPLHVEAVPY